MLFPRSSGLRGRSADARALDQGSSAMRVILPYATLALALCWTLGPVPAAGAVDMVANGGFEAGPPITPAQAVQSVPPGSTALTGWGVIGGSIMIVTDSYWEPHAGHRSVALSATGPGGITQSFPSSAGAAYRVTFWLSGEPFSSPTVKHLHVQAGSVTRDFTFDVSPAWHWDMKWAEQTVDFTGTGSTTTLSFTSQDASSSGPAVDSVRVESQTAGVTPASFELALAPLAPDPLRGAGRIAFTLPSAQVVRLSVFDVQGREIDVLARGVLEAGPHELAFSPRGAGARSGLYFLVLRADERALVRRFTVIQ
jgi:choice-of-anchor C domain-containing protein